MQAEDKVSILICVAGGVASHFLFNKYEPRRFLPILSFMFGPPIIIALWLCPSNRSSATAVVRSYAIHLGSLIASVVIYRLSPYHPLASFPGPVICRVTRFSAFYMATTGHQHHYYKSLHARYGTHVRTGPNHVHISDASALPTIMSVKPFRRGERYDLTNVPGTLGSVFSIMDPQEHARRRKIWDKSLNTKSILDYQDMLSARISQLVHNLERREGSEVDLAEWLSCFSFDFMGDLAFGGAFQLMEQGSDVDGHMALTNQGSRAYEMFGTIPWMKTFLPMLPLGDEMTRHQNFAKDAIIARRSQGSSKKDIFYYLLDEEGIGNGPPSLETLKLESSLAIVAGSDTTGTALSNLFFYLLTNPKILRRLQEEVDGSLSQGEDTFSPGAVAEMKLLNAVINETLRLQPAVPTGVQRALSLGSGDVNVAGRMIPEGTTVQVSAYCVHRDPRYFYPDPESFLPDRWLETTSESKLDQSAYFPFSYGPTGCAGKGLALLELRMLVCSLIRKFEFELSPGFKSEHWENSLADHFIMVKGKLPVGIKTRRQ